MEAVQIGSEEALLQLPESLQQFLTFERFHLYNAAKFQNPSADTGFDTRYLPQNCGAFRLPCFWIKSRLLYTYHQETGAAAQRSLFHSSCPDDRVLLPIHPTALDYYGPFLTRARARDANEDGIFIWAVPTSSTRTLLAWPDQEPQNALFIKTTVHCSWNSSDRHLYRHKVACSVGLSRFMNAHRWNLPRMLRFFPESLGIVPRSLQDGGVIYRSIPDEVRDGRCWVAPLFSLLGGNQSHSPLLLTILERTGMQPLQFLEEVLCAQFAKLWLEMTMRFGVILEAHGQDLMLALSPTLTPLKCFYYRDFEGLQVDWALRHSKGFRSPHLPHAWAWRETYDTWGYRYGSLVSRKIMVSLRQFLHLLLSEVDRRLQEWRQSGVIDGVSKQNENMTMIFSRHMFREIEQMFGVRIGAEYDIYRSINKFVTALMKLRKALIEGKITLD